MANEPDDRPWRRDGEEPEPRRRQDDSYRDDDDRYAERRPRYREQHRGMIVLIMGILGFAVCGICGIVAWVMGNGDLKKMDAGVMDPEGRGLTQAGKIMGMIATILMILTALVMVAIFGFAFVAAANAPAPNNQFQPAPVVAPKR